MEKKNQLKSYCKNGLSSREVVARDLPHLMPLLLLNRKQQPYSIWEVEDPGTLRAAKLSGMTPLFNNGNICPTLYSVQKHYGMTSEADRFSRSVIPQGFYAGYSERNVKAFTLIELLVVVLIIGILAAVAVPQYQKAVYKTRYATLKNMTQAIADAQKVYYLANSTYATDFNELSIDTGGTLRSYNQGVAFFPWGHCELQNDYVQCTNYKIHMQYRIYHDSARMCLALETQDVNSVQNKVCKQETKKSPNYIANYTYWAYQ